MDEFNNFMEQDKPEEPKEVKPEDMILDFVKNDPEYFYPENYVEKYLVETNMPTSLMKRVSFFGLNSTKRNNIFFVSEEEIAYSSGPTHQILNLRTMERKLFEASEVKGVGCIAVSNDKKYIAVGECGYFPNIMIYKYDTSEFLYRILRKGTETAYSALSFNEQDTYLASAGSDPDHNLIIWNWRTESIILKAKAFSQEVFSIRFSDNFEGKLITSGMGHIKFWEMAKTFTGLKLQGDLGKFGQVDLSDVSTFLEFPDGKILCGTEQGTLLLWEGIFIKTQISISEKIACHGVLPNNYGEDKPYKLSDHINCMLESLQWQGPHIIVSGGHDGYVKWWLFDNFENAEIDDNSCSFIRPIHSHQIINPITHIPAKIINIIGNYNLKEQPQNEPNKYWIIQDGNGAFLKASLIFDPSSNIYKIESVVVIIDFPSGDIIKAQHIEGTPYLLTQGQDNKAYLFNVVNPCNSNEKIMISSFHLENLNVTATFIQTPSFELEESLVIYNGYSNGLLRVLQYDDSMNHKLHLVNQIKIHESEILFLLVSPDKSWLLSATNREVFILLIQTPDNITPLYFIKRDSIINDIDWLSDSKRYIIALSDGSVEEITVSTSPSTSATYELLDYESKKMFIRNSYAYLNSLDPNRKKKMRNTDDTCKSKVISCKFAGMENENEFFVTCGYPYEDYIFLVSFDIASSLKDDSDPYNNGLRPLYHWKVESPRLNVTRTKGMSAASINVNHSTTNTNQQAGAFNSQPQTSAINVIPEKKEEDKGIKNYLVIKHISNHYIVVLNMTNFAVQIFHKDISHINSFIELYPNPVNSCKLSSSSCFVSGKIMSFAFSDGTVITYAIDLESILKYCNFKYLNFILPKERSKDEFNEDEYNTKLQELINKEITPELEGNFETGINSQKISFSSNPQENLSTLSKFPKHSYQIIDDSQQRSLQELMEMKSLEKKKKDAELLEKETKANEKKNDLRTKINLLCNQFKNVLVSNSNLPEELKFTSDELVVDDHYIDSMKKGLNDSLNDIKHKYNWHKAIIQGTIDRYEEFYLKSVKTNKTYLFTLNKEKPRQFATTIRCPSLPDFFEDEYQKLSDEISKFKNDLNFELLDKEYIGYIKTEDGLDKNDDEEIHDLVSRINSRIEDFKRKTNTKTGERVDFGKDLIKKELDFNISEMKDLEKFKSRREEKKKKQLQLNSNNQIAQKSGSVIGGKVKCPNGYVLKINYDVFYDETLMKTTVQHKLAILDFLKILYLDREKYNQELLELREKKQGIIRSAKKNKLMIIEINNELGIRSVCTKTAHSNQQGKGATNPAAASSKNLLNDLPYIDLSGTVNPLVKVPISNDAKLEYLDWLDLDMSEEELSDTFLVLKQDELHGYALTRFKELKNPGFQMIDFSEQAQNKENSIIDEGYPFAFNNGNPTLVRPHSYSEMKVLFKDRGTKKTYESEMSIKFREIKKHKLEIKKKKIEEETREMINTFDKEVITMRKKKLDVHFKQKLGELELFIKHEEYNILRAFETDDNVLIRKLLDLYRDYQSNLNEIKDACNAIQTNQEKKEKNKLERDAKIAVSF